MNHEPVNDDLLRRLEAATPPSGQERPGLLDVESRRLHEGWQIVSQVLDRVVAEHDSVLIEDRVRAGVERRIAQRRWRRRAGFVAIAASLLLGLMLGAWYNQHRGGSDQVVEVKSSDSRTTVASSSATDSAAGTRRDGIDNEWPVGTPLGPDGLPFPIDAASHFWHEDFDWQVATAREVLWDIERRWHDDTMIWADDAPDRPAGNPDEVDNDST
jgi:hypothetical protein